MVTADDATIFNTVRVKGQNYVNMADFVLYHGFNKNWVRKDQQITLQASTWKKVRFKVNSRECLVNGTLVWLNDSPIEYRNSILISEVDAHKTLNPLLRSWAVQQRKVKTVMIDPGHGGEDPGTEGYRDSREKQLTLDLAKRIEKLLRKANFRTLMTRRQDAYISLEDRSELANASEVDIFVSIHFNSAKPDTRPKGIETYCLTPVGLSPTGSIRKRLGLGRFNEEPANQFDSQNILLAYFVQQKLLQTIPDAEDRGVKRERFFVIRETERPSILVESGFLSNPGEEKLILSAVYRDSLATGIVEGIKSYANLMNAVPKKK